MTPTKVQLTRTQTGRCHGTSSILSRKVYLHVLVYDILIIVTLKTVYLAPQLRKSAFVCTVVQVQVHAKEDEKTSNVCEGWTHFFLLLGRE